jgi:hypothetical protein
MKILRVCNNILALILPKYFFFFKNYFAYSIMSKKRQKTKKEIENMKKIIKEKGLALLQQAQTQ